MQDTCLFCKLQSEKAKLVYENESCYVLVDRFPISNRHLLVITKEHFPYFHECPATLLHDIMDTVKVVVDKMKFKKYNLVQNNINQQMIKHVHFHVIESNESGSLELGGNKTISLSDVEYTNLVDQVKNAFN